MKTLALFDFDGTVTDCDSLIKFIRFAVGDIHFFTGLLILSPILVLYKLKIIRNYYAKQIMLRHYFKGMKTKTFKELAEKFSLEQIPLIVRSKALETINWHTSNQHTVIVVTASLECWLKPWCDSKGIGLIATKMKTDSNQLTGELLTKNCFGQEKVNRLLSHLDIDSFDEIYAYGDSRGDQEMLAIATYKSYKPFR